MKSTDMFLSANERKKQENPIVLNIPSLEKPKGLAPSPFVVSLWDSKEMPKIVKTSQRTDDKNNAIVNTLNENYDEELETIENLFRGNGRIQYHAKSSFIDNNYKKSSYLSQTENKEKRTEFYSKNIPKKIKIPSRKEQIEKIKQSKDEYSAIFKKPSQNNGGFFRNFAFWK